MAGNNMSTRRNFLKVGALLSAPLAAAPAAAFANDELKARVARLEDEAAIRELHQTWLRRLNAGSASDAALAITDAGGAGADQICSIGAHHAGPLDEIKIGPDGKSATGRFHCMVELETALARDCTFAQMAHLQGGGFVRRTEKRVLDARYVKSADGWSVVSVELAKA